MAYTTVCVEVGTKSRLELWAQKYAVDCNTVVKALLDAADSRPYNRSLVEHLILLRKTSKEFDRTMDEGARRELARELQALAEKSQEFVVANEDS